MVITSAEGVTTEFVLVGDFGNPVTYMLRAKLTQSGNNITLTSGSANTYIGFDGNVTVKSVSRNMLGRYSINGKYIRFYNPVYNYGNFVIEVMESDGTATTYNVTVEFNVKSYSPVVASLRGTYEIDGNTITVTANAGVSNVYLQIGKYYGETLSTANANASYVKQIEAKGWRIYNSSKPVEFDIIYDASSHGGNTVTRHFVINF